MPRGKVTQVKVVGSFTPLLVGLALMMVLLSGCGVAFQAFQEEVTKGRNTSSIRLELPPTNNSGVSGSATFTKAAIGTRVEIELRSYRNPTKSTSLTFIQALAKTRNTPTHPKVKPPTTIVTKIHTRGTPTCKRRTTKPPPRRSCTP
jgi:hypothetical protein